MTPGKVQCLECIALTGGSKEFTTLTSHLKAHVMSVADYRAKYGDEVDIGWSLSKYVPPVPSATPDPVKGILDALDTSPPTLDPNAYITESLTDSERNYFTERYAFLMRCAEDDRALESQIRDIVIAEIHIMRYQKQLSVVTGRLASGTAKKADFSDAKMYQELVNKLREQNLKDIKSLNITREQRQAQKKSIESTPSRLVTMYYKWIASLAPDELIRQREDELEATRRLQDNLLQLTTLIPSDVAVAEVEVVVDADDDDTK